jgi:hypothetical protein
MAAPRSPHSFLLAASLAAFFTGALTFFGQETVTRLAPQKAIPAGVYDIGQTTVIPRQRKIPLARDKSKSGVPAPYNAKEVSQPGGWLRGEDRFGTVLRFAPTIKGALIQTEDFGTGRVGAFWNDENTQGDTKLQANICSMASNFTVDGRAEIRSYPWAYTEFSPKPDVHGPDHPVRADGLRAQGNGFIGERLRFFQIPGTALVLKGGGGKQAGAFGIYDSHINELHSVWVAAAINGIVVESSDSKLHAIYITGIVRDGLTISGPGTVVDVDHVYGADRAVVVTQPAEFHAVYHEAARIGTHILGNAHGTRIDGLNIGPGTCWERGVKIETHGNTITGLTGTVRAETAAHPDIAGVEIMPRLVNQVIQGDLTIDGDGSEGVILRGHRHKIDLKGGWNKRANATFVRVAEGVTGCTVELRGWGDGGTVLDLAASGLDRVNGQGNEFKVKWSGTAKRVIYPGGGATYNLAPGTQLWIDGRLQSRNRP